MLQHSTAMTRARQRRGAANGFTLVELLVVIVILGILAAVVVFAVAGIGDNAKENACKTEGRTVKTAYEAYYAQFQTYPTTLAQVSTAPSSPTATTAKLLEAPPTYWTITGSGVVQTAAGSALGTKCPA